MHMHELTCTCLEFDEERAGIAGPPMKDEEVGDALRARHPHGLPASTRGCMRAGACMYTAHAPSEAVHARGVEDDEAS